MARFYAMTTYIDGQLGRLRNELKALAHAKNTILVCMTDNTEFKGWFANDTRAPSASAPSYFAYVNLQ